MNCKSILLPLLLDDCMDAEGRATHRAVAERVGVRRIKSTNYISLIPAFSLKGEGAGTCVEIYTLMERALWR
jgi:hypothetical protein